MAARRQLTKGLVAGLAIVVLVLVVAVVAARRQAEGAVAWRVPVSGEKPMILDDTDQRVLVGHDDGLVVLGVRGGRVHAEHEGPRPVAATWMPGDPDGVFVYEPGAVGVRDLDGGWVWRAKLAERESPFALGRDPGWVALEDAGTGEVRVLDLADGVEQWRQDAHLSVGWMPQGAGLAPLDETDRILVQRRPGGAILELDPTTGRATVTDLDGTPFDGREAEVRWGSQKTVVHGGRGELTIEPAEGVMAWLAGRSSEDSRRYTLSSSSGGHVASVLLDGRFVDGAVTDRGTAVVIVGDEAVGIDPGGPPEE